MSEEQKSSNKKKEKQSVFTVLRLWSVVGTILVLAIALYQIIRAKH